MLVAPSQSRLRLQLANLSEAAVLAHSSHQRRALRTQKLLRASPTTLCNTCRLARAAGAELNTLLVLLQQGRAPADGTKARK